MKTYIFFVLLASTLIFNSCGGDCDPEEMQTECSSTFTCEIDGVSTEFMVISSTVVNIETNGIKEILIASVSSDNDRLDIQLLIPIDENICMDLGSYDMSNTNIPMSVSYYKVLDFLNVYSADNILINRGSGSITFSDCNVSDLFLNAEFSFNCINNIQKTIQITNGKMEELCFATEK